MRYFEDIFSGETEEILQGLIFSERENFADLIALSCLDPKKDLRHCDLSGVDFSDCDLTGFDFTGCNLSGCVGVNVLLNKSTEFKNANVSDSCFTNFFRERKIFSSIGNLDEYERLKDSFWTEQCDWISHNLKLEKDKTPKNKAFAEKIYRDSDNLAVKNHAILFLKRYFDDQELRDFFIHNLLSKDSGKLERSSAISGLLIFCKSDELSYRTILHNIGQISDENIEKTMQFLIYSDYVKNYLPILIKKIKDTDNKLLEHAFIVLYFKRFSKVLFDVVRAYDQVDFLFHFTEEDLNKSASRFTNYDKKKLSESIFGKAASDKFDHREIVKSYVRAKKARAKIRLRELNTYGAELGFSDEMHN